MSVARGIAAGTGREYATLALASGLYLALTYLGAMLSRLIAAPFLHPAIQGGWHLRYALTVGVLELVGAATAALAVAYLAQDLADRPRRLLIVTGVTVALCILIWPGLLTSAATAASIIWTVVVHALAPIAVGEALRSRRRAPDR